MQILIKIFNVIPFSNKIHIHAQQKQNLILTNFKIRLFNPLCSCLNCRVIIGWKLDKKWQISN